MSNFMFWDYVIITFRNVHEQFLNMQTSPMITCFDNKSKV